MNPDGTPKTGETVEGTQPLAPNSNPTPAPVVDNSEVERLRKEAEQRQLRINQLENEARQRREQEEEAERKKLEENNEWKTIADRNAAELADLRRKEEDREKSVQVQSAQVELEKAYDPKVLELAKTFGARLASTEESDKKAFTDQLEAAAKQLGTTARVQGNNPAPNATPVNNNDASAYNAMRASTGLSGSNGRKVHQEAVHSVLGKNSGLAGMREVAGYNPVQQ